MGANESECCLLQQPADYSTYAAGYNQSAAAYTNPYYYQYMSSTGAASLGGTGTGGSSTPSSQVPSNLTYQLSTPPSTTGK